MSDFITFQARLQRIETWMGTDDAPLKSVEATTRDLVSAMPDHVTQLYQATMPGAPSTPLARGIQRCQALDAAHQAVGQCPAAQQSWTMAQLVEQGIPRIQETHALLQELQRHVDAAKLDDDDDDDKAWPTAVDHQLLTQREQQLHTTRRKVQDLLQRTNALVQHYAAVIQQLSLVFAHFDARVRQLEHAKKI